MYSGWWPGRVQRGPVEDEVKQESLAQTMFGFGAILTYFFHLYCLNATRPLHSYCRQLATRIGLSTLCDHALRVGYYRWRSSSKRQWRRPVRSVSKLTRSLPSRRYAVYRASNNLRHDTDNVSPLTLPFRSDFLSL